MIFVDDLKWAVGVMFHPDKNSKETMDSIGAFIRYYKASLIPLLVAVIIEILLSSILAAAIASGLTSIFHLLLLPLIKISPYYGNLMSIAIAEIIGALALALLIVGTIFFVWIAVPVYLFITSMIYFIIGRWVLRIFKNEYDNTASAFVYSAAPLAVFAWVIAIPLVGPFVLIPLLLGWQFVILIYALANQEGISKKTAAIFAFVISIIIWALGFLVGI
jgi:hypothetical protein